MMKVIFILRKEQDEPLQLKLNRKLFKCKQD